MGSLLFPPDEPQHFRVATYLRTDPNSWILSEWAGPVLAIPKPDPATPPAPTGLHVAAVTETTITWAWDAVAGADGYRFRVQWDSGAGSTVIGQARGFGHPPSWEAGLPAPNLSGEATVAAYFGDDPETATWSVAAPPVEGNPLDSEPFPPVDVEELVIRERALSDRPDDLSGEQVHFVYAVASDGQDHGLDTSGVIAELVGNVQVFLRRKLGRQLRIDTYGGRPDITFVGSPIGTRESYGAETVSCSPVSMLDSARNWVSARARYTRSYTPTGKSPRGVIRPGRRGEISRRRFGGRTS